MKLYLVRHGEYLLNGLSYELSEKGATELGNLAHFIHGLNLRVSGILHSGKTRAMQTAEILATGFFSAEPPRPYTGLNPEDGVGPIIDDVLAWNTDLVLVGHLPFMGRCVAKLLVRDETKEIVTFHPGTIVCLEGDANSSFSISWALTASLFP